MPQRDKVPATSGQVGEIAGALIGEMNFSKNEAKAIIGKMGAFRKKVREFYLPFRINTVSVAPDLARWEVVYGKLLGKKPDLSDLRIPDKPEGFGSMRLIVVAQELLVWTDNRPLQGTQDSFKKYFSCWQYASDLDKEITINDRDPKNGSYAVWVRDVREADEEFANKSADDLKTENHAGIITLERQLMEADWFFEKNEHLDQQNVTLCTGSRGRDGRVPFASWYDGFYVSWCDPSFRHPCLRSRRVWA